MTITEYSLVILSLFAIFSTACKTGKTDKVEAAPDTQTKGANKILWCRSSEDSDAFRKFLSHEVSMVICDRQDSSSCGSFDFLRRDSYLRGARENGDNLYVWYLEPDGTNVIRTFQLGEPQQKGRFDFGDLEIPRRTLLKPAGQNNIALHWGIAWGAEEFYLISNRGNALLQLSRPTFFMSPDNQYVANIPAEGLPKTVNRKIEVWDLTTGEKLIDLNASSSDQAYEVHSWRKNELVLRKVGKTGGKKVFRWRSN